MSRYVRPIPFLVLATIAIIAMAAGSQLLRSAPNLYAHHDNADTAIADQAYVPDIFASDAAGSPQSLQLATSSRQLKQAVVGRSTMFTITLEPGWNAVYLPVQPEASDIGSALAGIPARSVWSWDQSTPISSPPAASDLEPGQTGWLAYFPAGSESAALTNLFAVNGGRSYLIELDGENRVDWTVSGQPVLPPADWLADSYNLVGFHVSSNLAPTFAAYFGPSEAHRGQEVYQLTPAGSWSKITNLSTAPIRAQQAYLVYSRGASEYSGPLKVTIEQGDSLDFGTVLDEQTLRIANRSSNARQITVQPQSNEAYLAYWTRNQSGSDSWQDFPKTFEIRPNEELALRVAVKRSELNDDSPTLHHSALAISDGAGVEILLPVAVESLGRNMAGLWVGTAVINQVSQPTNTSAPNQPQPTGSEFQFRLIVHVDAHGQAKLLQQVMLMWKEGMEAPDPNDSSLKIVTSPGKFVLVTKDKLLSKFRGATMRDGKQVGRRISSAAFSFQEPVAFTGTFGSDLQSAPITIDYDDPLNPFKHEYHPSHDNLGYDFRTPLPEGRESFTIVRRIDLNFAADGDKSPPGWGTSQVGGTYNETIQGVHKNELYVQGTFQLQRVSTIDTLNEDQ